jgi:hypothetical protein
MCKISGIKTAENWYSHIPKVVCEHENNTVLWNKGVHIEKLLPVILTPWCRIFFEKLMVTQLVKQQLAYFMEPEGSLLWSQKSATGPYPEPAESSSSHRSLSP